jgi:UrcA family protein
LAHLQRVFSPSSGRVVGGSGTVGPQHNTVADDSGRHFDMSNQRPFVTSSRLASIVLFAIFPMVALASSGVAWAGDSPSDTARQLCADVIRSLNVSTAQNPTTCIHDVLAAALRNFDSTRASDPNTATLNVSLADLDLSTAEGKRVAHKRLRRVAERLCSRLSDELDLGRAQHAAACIERTMTDVQSQITGQQLAARSTTNGAPLSSTQH